MKNTFDIVRKDTHKTVSAVVRGRDSITCAGLFQGDIFRTCTLRAQQAEGRETFGNSSLSAGSCGVTCSQLTEST